MKTNLFQQFAEDLYRENLRGAYALESMKYGIMSRTGLNETDALEVACRIVASDNGNKAFNRPPHGVQVESESRGENAAM